MECNIRKGGKAKIGVTRQEMKSLIEVTTKYEYEHNMKRTKQEYKKNMKRTKQETNKYNTSLH